MIKTIFVPASGTQSDQNVFSAAIAVARPLGAHLDFYHQRVSASEAAIRLPHVQFCVGPAINNALGDLAERDNNLSAVAAKHFEEFCMVNKISIRQSRTPSDDVSADWSEGTDQAETRLMFRARHSDLVVVGRSRSNDLMPGSFIEWLLMGSGRPILIAPESAVTRVTGTVVVGWKETPEAAHALAAAMPLLKCAERVVLLSAAKDHAVTLSTLEHVAKQLEWHGIVAETDICGDATPASVQLLRVAQELHSDLLIVGGYGRGPFREAVCGGVTRALIERATLPIFMMH